MSKIPEKEILDYHRLPKPGKISTHILKPCETQRDLSVAYSPGVAVPCLKIAENPRDAYRYTGKGNLVAVITNGSAVLGLGNIGPLAGKPVMEGKAVLFKKFSGIDVFDIELNTDSIDEMVRTVEIISPTFGGINLEDIKAPECFEVERRLKEKLDIPLWHDDQHGTALIATAALINGLEIAGKKVEEVKVVMVGAGAAGIAIAKMFVELGARKQNILVFDSKGPITNQRPGTLNPQKAEFARDEPVPATLVEGLNGADVFLGVSRAGLLKGDDIKAMAAHPIVMAMANPDPEISYEEARAARTDVILCTGRSDYPNQVNNVLGFPGIFRGALDCGARCINEPMKIAAAKALADLAKEPVPDEVLRIYGGEELAFGPDYIIPKPFDPRVVERVAMAVAKAAMESGVARLELDLDHYLERLAALGGSAGIALRGVYRKAQRNPARIVFPEGDHDRILLACDRLISQNLAKPILLGQPKRIKEAMDRLGLDIMNEVEIRNPRDEEQNRQDFAELNYQLRNRRGTTREQAIRAMDHRLPFALMMLQSGQVDGMVGGADKTYPETLGAAMGFIGSENLGKRVSGFHVVFTPNRLLFFGDTTMNIEPNAQDLADIAGHGASLARTFNMEPKVAFLSFSNFGDVRHPRAKKVREAVALFKKNYPQVVADGEMHLDVALSPDAAQQGFPQSDIQGDANVLIFPELQSGNIGYKLVRRLAGAEVIGPVLMGMARPVNVVAPHSTVRDIVNMTAITAILR